MTVRILLALACLSLVAGCAQGGPPRGQFSRVLANAPGAAQPSRIVAREIAMLQRAREIGQYAASAEFAAEEAMVLSRAGQIPVSELRASGDVAPVAPWTPKAVWMSCDGRFAVSEGRFTAADGRVGDYVTTWRENSSGEYIWVHNAAALDNPQPVQVPREAPKDDEIVVEALVSVKGHVTDCDRPTGSPPAGAASMRETLSPDGRLSWRWSASGDERIFRLYAWTESSWKLVFDKRWPMELSK